MTFIKPTRGDKNWDVTLNATLDDLNSRIEAGIPGVQGTTGFQGVQGRTGTRGSTGPQGAQGTTGATGAGIQGATGTQGSTGTQGTDGAQGSVGAQGATGEVGAQGTTGIQGETGAQGELGSQGTAGSSGAQGSQGTQGTQGLQGTQSAQGIQGITGATGPAGAVTSFASTWSGTGLTYTGTPTSGSYMQNGKFTAFYININCATVTNFGNIGAGYSVTLPVSPAHNFNVLVGQVTKSDGKVYGLIGKGTAGSTTMTLWTNEKNQTVMDKDSPYGAGGITTSTTFTLSGTYIAS